jgi:branched-subunit amino acid transport protein
MSSTTISPSVTTWIIILALALVVIGTRNLFVFFGKRFSPSGRFSRALDFAPVAALVAIVVPEFVRAITTNGPSLANHLSDGRLIAGLVLLAVGITTRNSLYALLGGAVTYLLLLFIGSAG